MLKAKTPRGILLQFLDVRQLSKVTSVVHPPLDEELVTSSPRDRVQELDREFDQHNQSTNSGLMLRINYLFQGFFLNYLVITLRGF